MEITNSGFFSTENDALILNSITLLQEISVPIAKNWLDLRELVTYVKSRVLKNYIQIPPFPTIDIWKKGNFIKIRGT